MSRYTPPVRFGCNNRIKPLRGSMKKSSKSLTKRVPRKYGSIKNIGITEMEKIEYRQTGMIKIKDTAVGCSELQSLSNHGNASYYDFVERDSLQRLWDDLDLL